MKSFASTPWTKRSQIIIALDIGTTHSAVSFAFLNRGGPQSVHRVVEWPGQEAQRSESKIPSILWYDSDKKVFMIVCVSTRLGLMVVSSRVGGIVWRRGAYPSS